MIRLIIQDIENKDISIYFESSENRLFRLNEPNPGIFIAESPKVIARALKAGYEPISILVCTEELHEEGKNLLASLGEKIPVYEMDETIKEKMRGFSLTNGMLCAMKRKVLTSIKETVSSLSRIAVLENVENPTNVGAAFRSAAALGMEAVILTNGSSDPLYRRAARVSMGTVFQIPWTFADTDTYIKELKELGFTTVAMALREDSFSVDDERLKKCEKLAVILGNEGDGMLQDSIDECDYTVMIPMSNGVDSLNVAAASSVAFWELSKRI